MEETMGVVKAWKSGRGSIMVTMPRELDVKPGTKFTVKRDEAGRVIYEPIVSLIDEFNNT